MTGVPSDPLGDLEKQIKTYIERGTASFPTRYRESDGGIYVIKYFPTKRLGSFLAAGKKLYASDTAGFTWGDAVYVAPLSAPLTTMMFGRIGVVGRIEPTRIYDATRPDGRGLYQDWI